jgi:hypothetical protein
MNIEAAVWLVTPFHLRERARQYRFAAALANAREDTVMFQDLAMSFEQLARQFGQAKARSQIALSKSIGVAIAEMYGATSYIP